MSKIDIRNVVERIETLPTLPTVVTQLLQLVASEASNASHVEAILARDPSLTATVMKLVNSSFYGFAGKIGSLQKAVVLLGFETIKSVALSATVFSAFASASREAFDRDAFWQHSIATGIGARVLAKECGVKEVDEAFVAGIVHDIGKVILDEYAPDYFDKVVQYIKEKDVLMYEAERAVLGFSHAQLGRWLATKWNLPSSLIDGIFYHHQPGNAQRAPELASLVHVGDICARMLKLGSGGDRKVPPLDPAASKTLELSQETLKKVLAEVPAEYEKAELFVKMARG